MEKDELVFSLLIAFTVMLIVGVLFFYLLQPYVFFELNIKDKNRGVMKDENPRGEK